MMPTIHVYRDTVTGERIELACPWGDHSGNIPPPHIQFHTSQYVRNFALVETRRNDG